MPEPLPLRYRLHAIQRMVERGITDGDVRYVVEKGEVIESYPDDQPYPTRLLLGWPQGRPVHIVTAAADREIIIITVYIPDPTQWEPGFTRRRKQ